eukprot:Seg1236.4 transcript_id=Seg1236.4/GoldUCD/mRNA.D3Y31 product="Fibroblast growth factor 1" protein_id=Seg1236.4/GoldUCD/D3Y31
MDFSRVTVYCWIIFWMQASSFFPCLTMKLHDQQDEAEQVDLQDPMSLVRTLLEKTILATHKRPRKAVSSYSIVTFKNKKREPKRKHAYPSNWGNFVLYCKTGWLLQVLPNGVVNGTRNINDPYAALQIQVLGPTLVRIKGIESGRYVAVSARGRLVSKRYPSKETLFQEEILENHYHTFSSDIYPKKKKNGQTGWYIGIRKNGWPKRASKARIGETCLQFLKVPVRVVGK